MNTKNFFYNLLTIVSVCLSSISYGAQFTVTNNTNFTIYNIGVYSSGTDNWNIYSSLITAIDQLDPNQSKIIDIDEQQLGNTTGLFDNNYWTIFLRHPPGNPVQLTGPCDTLLFNRPIPISGKGCKISDINNSEVVFNKINLNDSITPHMAIPPTILEMEYCAGINKSEASFNKDSIYFLSADFQWNNCSS